MLPPEIIDYVVLHELVHTLERNHGQGFWKRLASLMPDYPSRRAWLKQHGAAMVF